MKKKFQFTSKKHSRQGVIAVLLGLLAALIMGAALLSAYLQKGHAGKYVAILGFLAMLITAAGLCFGIRGMKEEDVYRLLPFLGCGVNLLLLAGYAMIYVLGW